VDLIWSPRTNKDGAKNHFYDNMALVKSGDLVFSFCDTKIKAVGVALGPAQTADKPNSSSLSPRDVLASQSALCGRGASGTRTISMGGAVT
jgi:hypothetical protein